jgi:hypothetical protein
LDRTRAKLRAAAGGADHGPDEQDRRGFLRGREMGHRRVTATAASGCVLLLAGLAASPASAATKLNGQVVGPTYVAGATSSAIPVLLSKESARRARLRSQVGILVVARRKAVSAAGGPVQPANLRVGDTFTASARITASLRRATYVRLSPAALRITHRSAQLSTAELAALLTQTRTDLAALSARVDALAAGTRASLDALDATVAGLRADLDAARRDIAALRSRLDALSTAMNGAVDDLRARIDQVRADLQPQVGALATQLAALGAVLGSCAAPASVVGRLCTLETVTAAVDPSAVTSLTARVTQLSGALNGVVGSLTGLTLSGDLPASLTAPVTSALTQLGGLQATVAGVSGTVTSLNGAVGGLQTAVGGLQTQLGAVDATSLAATVGNLVTALGADPSGLTPTVVTGLQAQVASLSSALGGVQAQVGSVDVVALSATTGTIKGQVTALQTTVASLCSAVNGQAIPVLGTLPLVGSVNGLLTAQLTDACP